jgi:hypothetical protein
MASNIPKLSARLALIAGAVCALGAAAAEGPIQDNSFLMEEAYNQEEGIVQHINTFQRFRNSRDWIYTFTQEWPIGGIEHQFSYTVPVTRVADSPDHRSGVGDIALNYRYQLVGSGETKLAIAPRVSVIVPSGNEAQGRGLGTTSYQTDVAMSIVLSPALVTHSNLGYTWSTRAKAWNVGQSLVWLAAQRVNFLVEAIYTGGGEKSAYVSPGVRWSYDFASGLQIVPGIAIPIGVGPSRHEKAIFLYLSFEHPFKKL